ncbi:MAG TPA: acylase [Actinobacteria bacterium]|nr:acylase [Actinomycetota bacterium]
MPPLARWIVRMLLAVVGLLGAFLLWAYWPASPPDLSGLAEAGAAYRAEILRDAYGVPHVFGATDADVAFGLAYAHAEDDFATIQEVLLAGRGRLASVRGRDAAPGDYLVGLLRIRETVAARYEVDLDPHVRGIVEAYAAGLNRYAGLHPDEALPGLFPVSGEDVVAVSVLEAPLLFGLDAVLADLYAEPKPPGGGSTAIAVGPSRAGGHTLLLSNTHQPWEGPVAWYEASVHSDEGWVFTGALFPGMPVHALGTNGDLAWTFTANHPDLVDVFRLELDPDDPSRYRVDGEWLELERREVPVEVRLAGRFRWTVTEEALWSVYGPVVRRPEGTYAVRYAGMGTVGIYQQLFEMATARSFDEWVAPLRRQGGLPNFNVVYADRTGRIFYAYHGLLPDRAPGYDWEEVVPGTTRETLWTDYLPFDELPQVLDPPSGFVLNANSDPWSASLEAAPDPEAYPDRLGIDDPPTNRSLRALELLADDDLVTLVDLERLERDVVYHEDSAPVRWARRLAETDAERIAVAGEVPLEAVVRAQELLATWDRGADLDDPATALVVVTLSFVHDAVVDRDDVVFPPSRLVEVDVPDAVVDRAFAAAIAWLVERRRALAVPWGEVNRLRRGSVDLPLDGGPDLLRAIYGVRDGATGTLVGIAGDTYTLFVDWGPDGETTMRSIHHYGAAAGRPGDPHHADQAPLFAAHRTKPVTLDEAELRADAVRVYAPGGS